MQTIIEPFKIKMVEQIKLTTRDEREAIARMRRVSTQSHIDYVIEAATEVFQHRATIRGLRITEEPRALRHFKAKFAEV